MTFRQRMYATTALVAVVIGCTSGQQGPERLKTVPVTGMVNVNGVPAGEVTVRLKPLTKPEGEAAIYAANPYAVTDADGTFRVSTYTQGDGLAAGEYAITFEWRKFDRMANAYTGPDRLGGQYSDPEKSEFKVEVTGEEEKPIELGPYELKKG